MTTFKKRLVKDLEADLFLGRCGILERQGRDVYRGHFVREILRPQEAIDLFNRNVEDGYLESTGRFSRHGGKPVETFRLTDYGQIHLFTFWDMMYHSMKRQFEKIWGPLSIEDEPGSSS